MPELPEIHYACKFINQIGAVKKFRGPIIKSGVSKMAEIGWMKNLFTVRAASRGKELQMVLDEVPEDGAGSSRSKTEDDPAATNTDKSLTITFGFGMSGKFSFDRFDQIPKHAHLQFFTAENPAFVLSFVDYRRFGTWHVRDFDFTRGPDPVEEYQLFRQNVLSNLDKSVFNKAICEAIMEQKFFNGIGNYLRAEILYRAKVRPFDQARSVLENLSPQHELDPANPDLLDLCNLVPTEVFDIMKPGEGYNPKSDKEIYRPFKGWLRCYMVDGMSNLVDRQGRTMWFSGSPGPMVPARNRSRHGGKGKRKRAGSPKDEEDDESAEDNVKKEENDTEDGAADTGEEKATTSKKARAKTRPLRKGKHKTDDGGQSKESSDYFAKTASEGNASGNMESSKKISKTVTKIAGKLERTKALATSEPVTKKPRHGKAKKSASADAEEVQGMKSAKNEDNAVRAAVSYAHAKDAQASSAKAKGSFRRKALKKETSRGADGNATVRRSSRITARDGHSYT